MRVWLSSAVAVLGMGILAPVMTLAQSHGGGGGHAGGASHAASGRGPMASGSLSPHASGSAPRTNYASRPLNRSNAYGGNWNWSGLAASRNRNGGTGRNWNRHVGYGYGSVGYSFFPYSGGYWDGSGQDINYDPNDPNQQPAQPDNYADNNPPQVPYVGPEPGDYPPPPYTADNARMPYKPGGTAGSGSASDGLKHPEVTLVFKDGRKEMRIQNYAMSQTKIFVRDSGDERDIAISDLDVPATMAANDQAGVDFELPVQR